MIGFIRLCTVLLPQVFIYLYTNIYRSTQLFRNKSHFHYYFNKGWLILL